MVAPRRCADGVLSPAMCICCQSRSEHPERCRQRCPYKRRQWTVRVTEEVLWDTNLWALCLIFEYGFVAMSIKLPIMWFLIHSCGNTHLLFTSRAHAKLSYSYACFQHYSFHVIEDSM